MEKTKNKKYSGGWNKGVTMGQKNPLSFHEILQIKEKLQKDGLFRDLALLCVGLDTGLRSSDLLALKRSDVLSRTGEIRMKFSVRQKKTQSPTLVEISEETKEILAKWLLEGGDKEGSSGNSYIFESRKKKNTPLTHSHYAYLVKKWVRLIGLDATEYSTHSIRRTVPSHMYDATGDVEACREFLGQKSLLATSTYLSVGKRKALAIASKIKMQYQTGMNGLSSLENITV